MGCNGSCENGKLRVSDSFKSNPHGTLLALAVPLLGSLIAEPLTGMVDTGFVAGLGAEPLAALGVGTLLMSTLFWVFGFLGIATQTEVGTLWGRRRREGDAVAEAARWSAAVVLLAAGIGAGLIAVGWPSIPGCVRAMGAEGRVAALAVEYTRIRLFGAPAVLITFAAFGALRGIQQMRAPLWIAGAVNALNIVLDYFLIFGFGPLNAMGVGGAALASSVSQWIGALWAAGAAWRALGRPKAMDWSRLPRLFSDGRDLFLRAALLNAFLMLTTRTATRIGAEAGAVHQVIRSAWTFTALFLDAFALAGQSLVAYFMGSGDMAAVRRAAQVVCLWSFGAGAVLGLGMLSAQPAMERVYVPAEALALFAVPWWICALSQPLNGLAFGTDGIHWGARDFRYLRNAVFAAGAAGAAALLFVDIESPQALNRTWLAAAAWVGARAALGILRVWPGIGAAPLRLRSAS